MSQSTKNSPEKAWEDQARAVFADAEIEAGPDMLREDPTRIDTLPAGMVPYWGLPEQRAELEQKNYVRADPQPERHPMISKGMVLYFTSQKNWDARRRAESDLANGAMMAADPREVAKRIDQEAAPLDGGSVGVRSESRKQGMSGRHPTAS